MSSLLTTRTAASPATASIVECQDGLLGKDRSVEKQLDAGTAATVSCML